MTIDRATAERQLSGTQPHVKAAGVYIGTHYDVSVMYGLGSRPNRSDHPKGLAIDFMVYENEAVGNAVADFLIKHKPGFSVTYVIWKQRINSGSGWELMEDRGGTTANHYDHVHASFEPVPNDPGFLTNLQLGILGGILNSPVGDEFVAGAVAVDKGAQALSAVQDLINAIGFLVDPKNWWRLALFVMGALLMIVGLLRIDEVSTAVDATGKAIQKLSS